MRRPVVALLVAFLAFSIVGCGGGGAEDAAVSQDTAPPAPVAPPAPIGGPEQTEPIPNRSPDDEELFEPFPAGAFVPAGVAGRLESKQPMILFFTDAQQKTTDDMRAEINAVVAQNRGAIDLLVFDIGKFISMSNTGDVKVDSKLQSDPVASQAAQLANELGVSFMPFMVIVDDQGYVIFKSRGVLDKDLIERQVQRAIR